MADYNPTDWQSQSAGGFNGYTFTDPRRGLMKTSASGLPNAIGDEGMFPKMAGYLLKGSQDAATSGMAGFESMYRARAQGEAAAFGEQQDRLGGEVASQGYSPDLVRRMLMGGQGQSQARIGQARGEADQGFQMMLAELQKNTGTELAGLTRDETDMLLQAWLAKKSRSVARKGAKNAAIAGVAGSALGAAGTAIGGMQ